MEASIKLDGVQVDIKRKVGAPKISRLVLLADLSEHTSIAIHNNSLSNNYRALKERLVFHKGERPIQPVKVFDLRAGRDIRKFESIVPRVSPAVFVGHYMGHKKRIYEKAAQSLRINPLTHRDSYISGFVKKEKFDFMKKPDQVPRLIQPRSPRFNVELGRFIQPMEKPIYQEIDLLFGHAVVMKGKNAEERAAVISQHWACFNNPVAVGIDAKRFDQHTGRKALQYEHQVYLRHCPKRHRRYLKRILRMQLTTRGNCYTHTGTVKYRIDGVRCSGDMNTSMGNIILMTHLTYDYLKSLSIKFRFINDGDDGVIFLEKRDLQKLSELPKWYADYGYNMQVEEPVSVIEQVEFCQCKPVWEGSKYIMCRHPDVITNRDAYTIRSVASIGQWNYYRGAIANCGLSCMGGMPVAQSFYAALGRGAKDVKLNDTSLGIYWLALGMSRKFTSISPEVRLSFMKAFDITPDEQIRIEKRYDEMVVSYRPGKTEQYLYR